VSYKSFYLYDVEFDLCYYCVGLPSIVMSVDRGEDRYCGLSKVRMVEAVGFRQMMWIVMLESTKHRVLGVDTIGQHVSSRVQYGMAHLLIRGVVGGVPCSHGAREVMSP
jgi:hypothetical protein